MIKIVHIVGARPQFIKCSPLMRAFKNYNSRVVQKIRNIIVHTGQHYDYLLSEVFFKDLGIDDPDYHLGVGSGTHGRQTGQILTKVEEILVKEKPSACLVYGDTNSTLGGALAAAKLHLPVIHIEAGLRSYNKYMPEEINRILTDHSSTLLFCPTENAVGNLIREGFSEIVNDGKLIEKKSLLIKDTHNLNRPLVFNVGDVMYDVLLYAADIAEKRSDILHKTELKERGYVVLTIHRAENTDNLKKLAELINFVVKESHGLTVVFPVHPRTNKHLKAMRHGFNKRVKLMEPLGYFDMLKLVKNCSVVFTDSGGLQKEAFWLKVPCVTLRAETEWVETLTSGWNILYKNYPGKHYPNKNNINYYGSGQTAEKIVRIIADYTQRRKNDRHSK